MSVHSVWKIFLEKIIRYFKYWQFCAPYFSYISLMRQLFHDGSPYHIESSPSICRANQWTNFYMIGTSVMKELKLNKETPKTGNSKELWRFLVSSSKKTLTRRKKNADWNWFDKYYWETLYCCEILVNNWNVILYISVLCQKEINYTFAPFKTNVFIVLEPGKWFVLKIFIFSTFAKFSEKLLLLTPWYKHIGVRIRG